MKTLAQIFKYLCVLSLVTSFVFGLLTNPYGILAGIIGFFVFGYASTSCTLRAWKDEDRKRMGFEKEWDRMTEEDEELDD